eukprot:1141549-Pelagomonas_calceolata.AAC.3
MPGPDRHDRLLLLLQAPALGAPQEPAHYREHHQLRGQPFDGGLLLRSACAGGLREPARHPHNTVILTTRSSSQHCQLEGQLFMSAPGELHIILDTAL